LPTPVKSPRCIITTIGTTIIGTIIITIAAGAGAAGDCPLLTLHR
jgi:hypothetical protein